DDFLESTRRIGQIVYGEVRRSEREPNRDLLDVRRERPSKVHWRQHRFGLREIDDRGARVAAIERQSTREGAASPLFTIAGERIRTPRQVVQGLLRVRVACKPALRQRHLI